MLTRPADQKACFAFWCLVINGGYILQPRKIDDSESSIKHAPPLVRELWSYLLRKVNHRDNGKFKRGTGFFRFEDIQNDLSWHVGYRVMRYSKPQLTKSLRRLREGNAIATSKATRGIFITILNYNYYQDPGNYEGNTEETTKVPRKKREGIAKNKKVKEVKNKDLTSYEVPEGKFSLPTKEDFDNASILKIEKDLKIVCDELYKGKIFTTAHSFMNTQLKKGKNKRAILHTLTCCLLKRDFEGKTPWGYCEHIIQIENGNYNEADYRKTT